MRMMVVGKSSSEGGTCVVALSSRDALSRASIALAENTLAATKAGCPVAELIRLCLHPLQERREYGYEEEA